MGARTMSPSPLVNLADIALKGMTDLPSAVHNAKLQSPPVAFVMSELPPVSRLNAVFLTDEL